MEPMAPERRGWRKPTTIVVALAVAATAALSGGAAASGGGGGVAPGDPPELSDVICLERCAGERDASVGSLVRVSGRNLTYSSEVEFAGAGGRISVAVARAGASALEAKVPEGAVTGTVRVGAAETPADRKLRIVSAEQIPDTGAFKLSSAQASPRKTYFDGVRPPSVTYMFQAGAPTDIRVEVVDRASREVVDTWVEQAAQPNTRNTARWDGRRTDGAVAANGDYAFRLASVAGGRPKATADSRFGFYRFRFPLDARHNYGDGYGAGRGHEGQDVFAKCGSAMRAARGGRVQVNDVHPAAGNFLVIDGKGTKLDFVYAHMLRRSPLPEGRRVRTGQKIGQVGQTGNASGCHLHFEVWSAPGWYEGGQALPSVGGLLKAWDVWS